MTWFKVDDTLAFHRKAVAAGNAAMGLWVRAGSWSAQQLTDGHIPDDIAATLGTPPQIARLVKVRFWERVEGGYQFHEWSAEGRQPTRSDVLSRQESARNAKRKARDSKRNTDRKTTENRSVPPANPSESVRENQLFSTDPQVNGTCPPDVPDPDGDQVRSTRPDPSRPGVSEELRSSADAQPDPIKVAQDVTRSYVDRQPMSKFPAILGIVRRAMNAGHAPETIRSALLRLADEGRSVTVETLRVELEGQPPPRPTGPKPATTDQRIAQAQDLKLAIATGAAHIRALPGGTPA